MGPGLDAEEVEDGVAACRAGPSWVSGFNAFEANEAGERAGA